MSSSSPAAESHSESEAIQAIIALLREQRGCDFSAYRPSTLERRLWLQVRASGERSPTAYLERLRRDPSESDRLIARLTIKVSAFFRTPGLFEALPSLLAEMPSGRSPSGPLRCWSAGCGQGEEPYSLAMVLQELDAAAGAASLLATDLDAAALHTAQTGCYPALAVRPIGPERLAAHFEPVRADRQLAYQVRPSLRASVRFAQHNLASSAPPAEGPFDLILCRNLLIYWSRAMQEQMQRQLVEQLRAGGLLCLGEAEWLVATLAPRFETIDSRNRIFRLRAALPGRGIQ